MCSSDLFLAHDLLWLTDRSGSFAVGVLRADCHVSPGHLVMSVEVLTGFSISNGMGWLPSPIPLHIFFFPSSFASMSPKKEDAGGSSSAPVKRGRGRPPKRGHSGGGRGRGRGRGQGGTDFTAEDMDRERRSPSSARSD